MRVEADLDLGRRDPARELARAPPGRRPRSPASSASSRTAAARWALVALALVRVDGAAREDPRAAHEARRRVALHEQHLERRRRRRAARSPSPPAAAGSRASPVFSSSPGPGRSTLHAARAYWPPGQYLPVDMSETATVQKWICESCGFIYDPADGDPDGGIPPGTAFEDIPDTLVLSGVRRAQARLRPLRGLDTRRRTGAPSRRADYPRRSGGPPPRRARRRRGRRRVPGRRDRRRAPAGAMVRGVDDRLGQHDRHRARRAVAPGYWLGGRLADRDPTFAGLCRLVLVAAALMAAVPFVAGPFLRVSVEALDRVAGRRVRRLAAGRARADRGARARARLRRALRRPPSVHAVDEAGRVAGRSTRSPRWARWPASSSARWS